MTKNAERSAGVRDTEVVQLDVKSNKNGSVTVTPEDENRFSLKMEHAVAACQIFLERHHFQQRFDMVLNRLGKWVVGRGAVIDSAWLTVRDSQFLFVVVRNKVGYDSTFEDDLSDLEIDLANDSDLKIVPLATLALPRVAEASLDCFLSDRMRFHFKTTPD